MASALEDLVTSGLADRLRPGAAPTEAALYQRVAEDIQRPGGNEAQAVNARTFGGPGLGLSSVSGYLQGQVDNARTTALAKTRHDAALASEKVQTAALGQAASNVQQNLERQQQGDQFDRRLSQQKSLANQQTLKKGLGGLATTAAGAGGLVFGKDIRSGLRGLAGVDEARSPGGGRKTMLGMGDRPGVPGLPSSATGDSGEFTSSPLDLSGFTVPDYQSEFGGGGGLAELAGTDFSGAGADFSGFDSSFGAFDDYAEFDPYQYDWGSYL